jgi:hypothetical protein
MIQHVIIRVDYGDFTGLQGCPNYPGEARGFDDMPVRPTPERPLVPRLSSTRGEFTAIDGSGSSRWWLIARRHTGLVVISAVIPHSHAGLARVRNTIIRHRWRHHMTGIRRCSLRPENKDRTRYGQMAHRLHILPILF